jgi:hypothetical protein
MLFQHRREAENRSQKIGVQTAWVRGNLGLPGSGALIRISQAHVKGFAGS